MPVYERVQAQLPPFDLTEAEGALVHPRVKVAEEGETSSRFFLRLEKSKELIVVFRNSVTIGVVVTDVEGVCESGASFYQYLFTACPVDLYLLTVSLYLFLLMMPLLLTVQSRE